MRKIIAYIGVIGSGKDYQANLRVKEGYAKLNFKDALIDMCSDIVGYDVREDYEWFKSHLLGMRRPSNPLNEGYCNMDTKTMIEQHGLMTGRILLQRVGTETMRKRDQDHWAKQWIEAVKKHAAWNIANADCRFRNECNAIVAHGAECEFKFVFCDYRSKRYDATMDHESEFIAQALLKMGLKNGQEISTPQLHEAAIIMERRIEDGKKINA